MRNVSIVLALVGCGEAVDGIAVEIGGSAAPVGTFRAGDGGPVEVRRGEVLVTTTDGAALEAFLARWDGEVLRRDAESARVRIRRDAAPAEVRAVLAALPESPATWSFSDARTASTVAVALLEDRPGFEVEPNLQLAPAGYQDRLLPESAAPDADVTGLGTWDPNAYTWPEYVRTGVADAWTTVDTLRTNGAISQVRVGLVDEGFDATRDLVAPVEVLSGDETLLASAAVLGTAATCGGAAGCDPWHGTHVASVLSALHGDGTGGAGVATPVIDPVYVWHDGSTDALRGAIRAATDADVDVINVSWRGRIPQSLAGNVRAVKRAVERAVNHRVLVVAAAGEDDVNVQARAAASRELFYPCEYADVLCVNAVGYGVDTLWTDGTRVSNRGNAGGVPLAGPGVLVVGPDPDDLGDAAHLFQGTSGAAAFVSGIAALTLAVDPSLNRRELADHLLVTAGPGGDARVDAVARVALPFESSDGAIRSECRSELFDWLGPEAIAGAQAPTERATWNVIATATCCGEIDCIPGCSGSVPVFDVVGGGTAANLLARGTFAAYETVSAQFTAEASANPDWNPAFATVNTAWERFTYSACVTYEDQGPEWNDAGLDCATARRIGDGSRIAGVLRHEDPFGHWYRVRVPAGSTLDLAGVTGVEGSFATGQVWDSTCATELVSAVFLEDLTWTNAGATAATVYVHAEDGVVEGAPAVFDGTVAVTP